MKIIYQPTGRAREYAPLAANLYKGCGHGCTYCYACKMAVRFGRGVGFHDNPRPRASVLEYLTKDCQKFRGSKVPVLLSFTTDPYQPIEETIGLTRSAIQIMHNHGMAVEILTKGGTRACRDFDLLTNQDAFASTLTFLDNKRSREWEPGAALPGDRLNAMMEAHRRGIPVWASLEPVIDPDESLEIIRRTHGFVDFYKVGMLNYNAISRTIDWRSFGQEAERLLNRFNKQYYLKQDLRKYLDR